MRPDFEEHAKKLELQWKQELVDLRRDFANLEAEHARLREVHQSTVETVGKLTVQMSLDRLAISSGEATMVAMLEQHRAQVNELAATIGKLKAVVQWTLERDTAWRGVHIDEVNRRLLEALNG